MKTQQILHERTKYNWFYLMLAIVFIYAAFHLHAKSFGWNLSDYDLNNTKLWLLLAGALYVVNWLYGTFYFPFKYNNILRKVYTENRELTDLSIVRGYASAIITIIVVFENNRHIDIWFIVHGLLWCLMHLLLCEASRTNHLFKQTSVLIDEVILMPWLERGDKAEHRYRYIHFISPTLEDQAEWTRRAIIAHVSHERATYMSEKGSKEYHDRLARNETFHKEQLQVKEGASELSAKIYKEIK